MEPLPAIRVFPEPANWYKQCCESEELPLDELVERLRERLKDALKEQNLRRANVEELNKKITKYEEINKLFRSLEKIRQTGKELEARQAALRLVPIMVEVCS